MKPRSPVKALLLKASVLMLGTTALHSRAQESADFLFDLSLEDLLNVEIQVSSISRRLQKLSESSAAIYVLTADDIRNSTALNVPDLLRTVPGLEVAQIDANKWAVSARGFNSRLAGKMLLIIDGRTIYSSSYAAVFWESEDIPLETIERIEVIRGPGATIWGANAINGVVSITTKSSAQATSFVSATAGTQYSQKGYMQYAGAVSDTTSFKVFATGADINDSRGFTSASAHDDWESRRVGFRVDSRLSAKDNLLVQGDASRRDINQQREILVRPGAVQFNAPSPAKQQGFNLVTRWQHQFEEQESFTAQFFYDRKEIDELLLSEQVNTYDLDFYYSNNAAVHNLTVGAGIRYIQMETTDTPFIYFSPKDETLKVYNVSFYDDIKVTDTSILGFGLKIEDNIYTGTEYQANLRFNQTINRNHNVWAAASRAVRTPSRAERSSNIVIFYTPRGSTPESFLDTFLTTRPSDQFGVEKLEGLELGWRAKLADGLSMDLATFYNQYSGLRNVEPGQPYCAPDPMCSFFSRYVIQPLTLINSDSADSHGFEALLEWQYSKQLSFEASYSYFSIDYTSRGLIQSDSGVTAYRAEPLTKLILQSSWKMHSTMGLDLAYRYVGDAGIQQIPAYQVLDAKFNWQVNPEFSLALMARNLGDGKHREFEDKLIPTTKALVEPSYHLTLNYSW